MFALNLFFALVSLIESRSNGATACGITPDSMSKGMGGSQKDLGYKINCGDCTYKPNIPLNITISGKHSFKGILTYIEGEEKDVRFGKFTLPSSNSSYKDASKNCKNAHPLSMFTHSSPAPKEGNLNFSWINDKCEAEKLKLHTVIAISKTEWQILDPVALKCAKIKCSKSRNNYNNPFNTSY